MKHRIAIVFSAVALALAIAGVFYWSAFDRTGRPAAGTTPAQRADRTAATGRAVEPAGRRVLYYRNAMGLPDTSPVPKKDAMGMDYIPVYAGEESSGPTVRISADKLQKLGVRTERAALRVLTQTLRIVGTLQPDERRQSTISPKFEGWITRLFVSTTGAPVRRGQPLLEVYSPDLVSAQQDYRVAVRALQALGEGDATARASMEGLVQSALERLKNWDIAESDLAGLRAGDEPRRSVPLRAPRDGVVTEKAARIGMRFMPGDPLYQITDLSSVWLIGSVFEQDLALVQLGAPVTASVVAYPGKTFEATVTFISPVLQPETRTVQVRVELPNPRGLLMPAMYGAVELAAGSPAPRLAVPDSAILDTGTRQLVLIDRGSGEFEPRTARLGVHADGYTEVLEGVAEHEAVVVNGNFLIDSESNLRAAIGGLGTHVHGAPAAAPKSPVEPAPAGQPSPHSGH
jgi:membrane fusion protein, copper/silver efflux system